ncbi:MAG: organic solvent tolerance protein OstA [Pirellulaceae bacterium]
MSCLFTSRSWAAEVQFPAIDPQFVIRAEGTEVAREQRGAYDILAFTGECKLEQGGFSASADEIILWIERSRPGGVDQPGKIICYLNGGARARWANGQELSDAQWMGRLFSLHPVEWSGQREVRRYDIPTMDWTREPTSSVQLAQFQQPLGFSGGSGAIAAPPLLGAGTDRGELPAPVASQIPPVVGAIPWPEQGNPPTNSIDNALVPRSGLVIPEDNGTPYPAAGIAPTIQLPNDSPPFPAPGPQVALQVPTTPYAAKTVQFFARNSSTNLGFMPSTDPNGEAIAQITGGFRLVISGVRLTSSSGTVTEIGDVSLEADNAVAWIRGNAQDILKGGVTSTPERPIELYLDGNIVFSQGNRVIYADRMYYNVSSEYGMVLSAEVLTPVPQYQGLLRLKADVLQQRDRQHLRAYGAAITSSRLGVPRYWLQADEVELDDERDETDLSVFAPTDARRGTNMRATANNNFVYLAGLPIAYWPTFRTNLAEPSFYLTSLKFKNDTIFGSQIYSEWDILQLLGIEQPEGTRLRTSVDYLSDRGPALGAHFDYDRPTWIFGAPGTGFTDAWFIRDSGLDTLGVDRVNLEPEETTRGRVLSRHRLFFSPNVELMAETGYISDRNFLEQFFENEWEQEKDFSSALRLRRYNGNRLLDIAGQARVNDFFTETEQLPAVDHYWLGQDLLGQRLTWSAQTNVGYVHQRTASTPLAAAEAAKFALLPWESDSEGLRAITRQELSMPLDLGAWKIIPFMSGEAGFWNEDVNQDDVTRLTGQAGVRTALPLWRVYPNIENRLFDLRGIAHKITWENEFFYADTNQDLDRFPLYDPLDDNSQEHFRRRFIFNTFGGSLPERFDERNFAVRSGMQRWVTAGSSEVVDDMMQLRTGVNQRWQTKRGLPGRERIVDLVSLDVDFIYFPKAERDNFGEEVGAFNYDFRYHVGDRLTLLSDGYVDVFSQGLKTFSAGAQASRPGRGDAYLGFLSIEGPISANVLNGFVNYRLNDKWIFSTGAAFDFASVGSIGQSLGLTRIGETALVRVGMNVDHGRDNVSFNFNIEPRFLPTAGLGVLGGELIPPAGLFGVE